MKLFTKGMKWFFAVSLVVLIVGISGCFEDGSDSSGSQEESGDIVISLTDAEGDFKSYKVDVLSLTLFKANGVIVDTLPQETTIDFSQYTDMTEFLTVATVPSGLYTGVTMTLDYQNAEIWVENANGEAVKVDNIIDENGNDVSTLTVTVSFSNSNPITIRPLIPAYLTLDFDLNASNKVVFDDDGIPTLTVEPELIADINPENPKTHRLRGPLKNVNMAQHQFTLTIRPCYHVLSGNHEQFGTLDVITDDDTVYDINGALYQGDEGLAAMNNLAAHTGIIATGKLTCAQHRFRAGEVYAGSSVPGGTMDAVTGNVVSRQEDIITLIGVSITRKTGSAVFNDMVTVQLSDDTTVTRQLSTEVYAIDDISVGQRITIAGEIIDENADSFEVDATSGFARMMMTKIQGTILQATDAIVMDLQSINNRNVDIFDFTGTGVDAAHDVDPDNYEVYTDTLDISLFTEDDSVKICGFVNSFGQAPYDFNAWTITDVSETTSSSKKR